MNQNSIKKKNSNENSRKRYTHNEYIYLCQDDTLDLFGIWSSIETRLFLFICRFFHPLLLALHTCLPILSIYVQHFSFIFYSCLSLKRCKCHFSFVFFFCIFPIFWNENDKMLLHILAFGERVLNREFG